MDRTKSNIRALGTYTAMSRNASWQSWCCCWPPSCAGAAENARCVERERSGARRANQPPGAAARTTTGPPSATRPRTKLIELAGSNARRDRPFLATAAGGQRSDAAGRARSADHAFGSRWKIASASAAVEDTTVTLSAKEMPLAEVFAAIEKQTGNRLIDNREQEAPMTRTAGRATSRSNSRTSRSGRPWIKILDQANLGIYSYGGEDALSIVGRGMRRSATRHGRPATPGRSASKCWKFKPSGTCGSRSEQSLKLQLEVAWEPRLRPIALSQPVADVQATTDDGGSSWPSASRTQCWMSKCRTARRRPKSFCRSSCRRARRQASPRSAANCRPWSPAAR